MSARRKTDFKYESCATCLYSCYDIVRESGVCRHTGDVIGKNLHAFVCDEWYNVKNEY